MYVLISQIRRSAISVCSNIAEGASRHSKTEKRRFYEISRGSLVEMDTQFEIALLLNYFKPHETKVLEEYIESIFRMLSKMIANLNLTSPTPTRH
jgi:four helix bundle protein